MHALIEALADRAAGRLTDADLEKVAALHGRLENASLEKVAAPGAGAAAAVGKRILDILGRSIEQTGPMIAAALAVPAVGALGRSAMDKVTKGKDLDRILEVYPHLKEYPRNEIELAYSSMRHMNQHLAKDPLAGGTLLGQMLRSRDPLNPKVLRFEPQLAGDLLRLNPREEHQFEEAARDAVLKGVSSVMDDMSRERSTKGQQAFMREQEASRRDFDMAREQSHAQEVAADRAHREQIATDERTWLGKSEVEGRAHQMTLEEHKAKLREQAETGRRTWETGQKREDHMSQDRRAVLSAMLGKANPDSDFYAAPITDPATGRPMIDPMSGQPYAEHHFSAPPQISHVLGRGGAPDPWLAQHYPHLKA